jgi:phosphopantothenoylcysteine decarboxylase/phosphopantothenate--cysteine ligase
VTTVDLEPLAGVETIEVVSAEDLNREVMALARLADVVVMAAAVADFRPERVAPQKLKKADGPPEFVLVPTIDTLAELGRHRRIGQIIVGFAAETQEVERNAQEKLIRKGADLMVVNDVTREGVGFTVATNAVTILDRDGGRVEVPLAPKSTIAHAVLDRITELLGERLPSPTE